MTVENAMFMLQYHIYRVLACQTVFSLSLSSLYLYPLSLPLSVSLSLSLSLSHLFSGTSVSVKTAKLSWGGWVTSALLTLVSFIACYRFMLNAFCLSLSHCLFLSLPLSLSPTLYISLSHTRTLAHIHTH